jgi:hypothetical protein
MASQTRALPSSPQRITVNLDVLELCAGRVRDTSVASIYEKLPIELALEQLAAASAPSHSLAPPAVCSNRSVIVDPLSAFGAAAVAAMLVCHALEWRSSWFVLASGGVCIASAVYGFLQGCMAFWRGRVDLVIDAKNKVAIPYIDAATRLL